MEDVWDEAGMYPSRAQTVPLSTIDHNRSPADVINTDKIQ